MIISEKNKAAQAIADALGQKQIIKSGSISVYYVPSKKVYVIPLRGHIMQHENSPNYKRWEYSTNREIITNPKAISKIPNSYAKGYIKVLKEYAKLCNRCIIGTDADVEGAVIGLIDAFPFVKQANKGIKVEQMWLNTLQKSDIVNGFNNTIPPKWSWAYSGEARAIIDATIGFSATREVTLALKPILTALNSKFASIGRVQTCLLYLLYLREVLIRNFVPDKYWTISALLIPVSQDSNNKNNLIKVAHVKNPMQNQSVADNIYAKVKDAKFGEILDIKKTPFTVYAPTPLNTSKALMLITKKLGITANMALKTMEDLYLNKIISYPRTDSDHYTDNYDHLQYLQKFVTHNVYGNYTQDLLSKKRIKPHNGKIDAGDHTPITPLLSLEQNSSYLENDLQKKVYNLLARHYLALFGESAEELKTQLKVSIEEEPFKGTFKVLVKEGFYEIAPFLKPQYDVDIGVNKGKIPVKKIDLEEKETQPPPRYTDTTLLKLMEQKNIGTKSTRPTHIDTLLKRLYVNRIKKQFYVLDLGFTLIDTLKTIWLSFLDPDFTKRVEAKLQEIQDGKRKMDDVVAEVKKEFLDLFDKFRQNTNQIIQKMSVLQKTGNVMRGRDNKIIDLSKKSTRSYTDSKNSQKYAPKDANDISKSDNGTEKGISEADLTTSLCPICKKVPMQLVITRDRKKFFACTDKNCKTYLPIPKKGYPRLLKSKCKICGFNIIKISGKYANGSKMQYYMCSNCWKKGLETNTKSGMCFDCKNYEVIKGSCLKRTQPTNSGNKKTI